MSKLFIQGAAVQWPSAGCLHAPTADTFQHETVWPVPGCDDAETPVRKSYL